MSHRRKFSIIVKDFFMNDVEGCGRDQTRIEHCVKLVKSRESFLYSANESSICHVII
jgi:hypothetical protein